MSKKSHWEQIYGTKPSTSLEWFQARAETSLRLIEATGAPLSAAIIDVGGGVSTLVDDLLKQGYNHLSVLELAASALAASQARLGSDADKVIWLEGDITTVEFPPRIYDIWHDRAVFHFLTEAAQRQAYVRNVLHALRPGGALIIATFAEEGPTQCSGLPVVRYSAEQLHAEFGTAFELLSHENGLHHTPSGYAQKFLYCHLRLKQPTS